MFLSKGAAPLLILLPAMVAAGAILGWGLHPGSVWRGKFSGERSRAFFLLTLGAALILEDLGGQLWPLPGTALSLAPEPIRFYTVAVSPVKLALLISAIILAAAVNLYLKKGRLGKAFLAWDQGNAPVWIVGIDPGALGRRVVALGFAISALAGGFLALSYTVTVREGIIMTVRCLVLAVLGGTLSPFCVLGLGIGLGMGEAWIGQIAGMRWGPSLGYGMLLIVLPLIARRKAW
jgi:branched-chain amino acid transport system permease protein